MTAATTPRSAAPTTRTMPPISDKPLRIGTRGSPLALVQTRAFQAMIAGCCPQQGFQEQQINTTGDAVLDRPLAEIGGKGLFAKEIHEALLDDRIDFAVHSLKDLETALPPGVVLACTLTREDPRDTLILGPACHAPDPGAPFDCLPQGAVVGTSSVRRQSQLLHARPDLSTIMFRGNVQTRLAKVAAGTCAASLLAYAGLRRLGLGDRASVIIDTDIMVPAACQGIVGITARADDAALLALLAALADPVSQVVAAAERALLAELDGSCRTPIGGHAILQPDGRLQIVGLVARADGGFLLKRSLIGAPGDAVRLGAELGASLRTDSPSDVFG